jgi:hypothetical protein
MIIKALSRLFNLEGTEKSVSGHKHAPVQIAGEHPLRDNAIGFLDSRQARLNIVQHIKDDLSDNDSHIIALDAQNLGILNDLVGYETANKIWQLYTNEYLEALSEQFPKADVLTGFRSQGDEAQIIISSKKVTEDQISKAFAKADKRLQDKFSGTGLSHIPSRDGHRPSGFKLHHAICAFSDLNDHEHRKEGARRDFQEGRMNAHMLDFHLIPELALVMTDLNQNKKTTARSGETQLTPTEFIEQHAAKLTSAIEAIDLAPPSFIVPEDFAASLPQEKDSDLDAAKQRGFLEQAAPDSCLVRFDLTGLRLLNKALHSVEVEAILGDIHREIVDSHFKIMSGTHDIGFSSHEVRSGVVDVLIDKKVWDEHRDNSIEHINSLLDRVYDFHIVKDYSTTWDKLGSAYYMASSDAERREALFSAVPAQKRELLGQLEKEFNYVEVPVIDGDIDTTLDFVQSAMDDLKAKKSASPATLARPAANVTPILAC